MDEFDTRVHYPREPVDKWIAQTQEQLNSAALWRAVVTEAAKVGKFPDVGWLESMCRRYEEKYADVLQGTKDLRRKVVK